MDNANQYINYLDTPNSKDYKASIYRAGLIKLLGHASPPTEEYSFVMNQATLQRIIFRNIPYYFSNTPKIFGINVYIAKRISDDVIAYAPDLLAKGLFFVFNSFSKEASEYIQEIDSKLNQPGLFQINNIFYISLDMSLPRRNDE